MGTVPGRENVSRHILLSTSRYPLLLIIRQNFVAIVFNASLNFADKVGGFGLKEPSEGNNAFRDRAKVVEKRRRSVRFTDVVNAIGSPV